MFWSQSRLELMVRWVIGGVDVVAAAAVLLLVLTMVMMTMDFQSNLHEIRAIGLP